MTSLALPAVDGLSELRVSATKTTLPRDPCHWEKLRETFRDCHVIAIPGFLDVGFVSLLRGFLEKSVFRAQPIVQLGERHVEAPPGIIGKALTAGLRRPNLLRFLEETTDCGVLGSVEGELATYTPQPRQALSWHDDRNDPRRRLAITINLGDAYYEGGTFELRKKHSGQLLCWHTHRAVGDALIFRVSDDLEHRVVPVLAGGPRHVYAGWFLAP